MFELASGGMATVYLAHAIDGRLGVPLVALKRPHRHLAQDKTFLSMIVDEARLASAIKHPNVVQVRELGFEAGEPFILLDYVEGGSLSDMRKELGSMERALDSNVAVRIALDALAGLHAAHVLKDENGKHLGIIHRDVSPHNVLVGVDGLTRLTDFGIAKAEDRVQVTRTHEVKGKLAYLAPERVDRRRICTTQSDVFSMAVVLWESLAGRRLFRGEEALDTLDEVIRGPIPTLRQLGSNISPALDEAIACGLSRDLEIRYKTARDFAQALERGAGRGGVATAHDVGQVVEAVFGPKLRIRHDKIRNVLGAEDAERLLKMAGLPQRKPVTDPVMTDRLAILAVAPAAPSARYAIGGVSASPPAVRKKRPLAQQNLAIGALGGLAIGAVVVWAAMHEKATATVAAQVQVPTAVPAIVIGSRKVHVRLPFLATGVSLDGVDHSIAPAADSFDVELAAGAPTRHRIVITSVDGSRAEGGLHEDHGVGVVDADGLALSSYAEPPPASASAAALAPMNKPILAPPRKGAASAGTVRNGFTKLK